jgi:hypothetical protein
MTFRSSSTKGGLIVDHPGGLHASKAAVHRLTLFNLSFLFARFRGQNSSTIHFAAPASLHPGVTQAWEDYL